MGKKIRMLVNYRNTLGIWNIGAETIICNRNNRYIKPENFAQWIGEVYLGQGCTDVVCIEINADLTKAAIKDLASIDIGFISEKFRKMLGQRWEFTKKEIKNQSERTDTNGEI